MIERYLYCFGFQSTVQMDADLEDSKCVWIAATNECEALDWGREVSERLVAERWPGCGSWLSGNYAHWIEKENAERLRWAATNAPSCIVGQFPVWTE